VTRVFVVDGAERTSLAIARSLGRRGIEVDCGESYRWSTASLSRYCRRSFIYPDPQKDCSGFIERLEEILADGDYDMIFSSREVTTIPIVYNKYRLEAYTTVPFPDYRTILQTHDKGMTMAIAEACGVPTPTTYRAADLSELAALADTIRFPVVVKSRRKTTWQGGTPQMLKVTEKNYVHSKGELLAVAEDLEWQSGMMPLVQEYVPGEGFGVEALLNHGEPRALFMHRRLREYPITGGASTLREGITDERMRELAITLLRRMQWHGVAMVEFKRDARDGTPRLMEVNGRFWGSLPCSIASGVDFPYLLFRMLIDGDISPVLSYRSGVQCRWLIPGDILWCAASLRNGRNKLDVLREFMTFRGIQDDIIAADDLLPSVGAVLASAHQAGKLLRGERNISGEVIGKPRA
jgi:predicted ATP-grasp superfamily ATP-dependent carboligase